MKRVAKFEKVSYEQFEKDYLDTYGLAGDDTSKRLRQEIESMYYGFELPTRATKFSAGFDIRTPFPFTLKPGEVIKIPTGIKCRMNTNYVLLIFPRSGLGFKYQCNLVNGTAVLDCDYINSDNEGHIFIKLVNRGNKEFSVTSNTAVAQGIFLEYGITEDDHVETERNGGFGSTDKKE
jgi:dUTP pyrophosphatase